MSYTSEPSGWDRQALLEAPAVGADRESACANNTEFRARMVALARLGLLCAAGWCLSLGISWTCAKLAGSRVATSRMDQTAPEAVEPLRVADPEPTTPLSGAGETVVSAR
jgi:hypothetical protein